MEQRIFVLVDYIIIISEVNGGAEYILADISFFLKYEAFMGIYYTYYQFLGL